MYRVFDEESDKAIGKTWNGNGYPSNQKSRPVLPLTSVTKSSASLAQIANLKDPGPGNERTLCDQATPLLGSGGDSVARLGHISRPVWPNLATVGGGRQQQRCSSNLPCIEAAFCITACPRPSGAREYQSHSYCPSK